MPGAAAAAAAHTAGPSAVPARPQLRSCPAAPRIRPARGGVRAAAGKVAVTFRVDKQTAPGEHVRVVGDPSVLGGWDVAAAPTLEPVEGGSRWFGTVALPVNTALDFKFVLVPENSVDGAQWEGIPNRTFQPGGEQTITAVWDVPGFEAGPAAPGTGGHAASHGLEAEVKERLEATLRRLSAEARAAR